MYAAIDDPNNQGDLYTSGSETYAQIQPHVAPVTVAVEINTTNGEQASPVELPFASNSASNGVTLSTVSSPRHSVVANVCADDQLPLPPVEILRTAHSRQGEQLLQKYVLHKS